ncbi:MAG: hypothetical protein OXU68_01545 [Bacteroidota bacterium]|nr:hypothetical protein [Bacteroidota bacterium]
MSEALSAHGHGVYLCVRRLLFPEIERILAVRGVSTTNLERLLDVRSLAELTSSSPVGHIIFTRLFLDVFAPRQERSLPNRGLSLNREIAERGLTQYVSHKHSMNMLCLTDYFLELLLQPKEPQTAELTPASVAE